MANTTITVVAICALVAVLQAVIITAAYLIGRHDGYWKRVEVERGARGII